MSLLSAEKKEKLIKTTSYYVAYIAFGLMAALTGPTLPELASHTKSRLDQISWIFTARALGYMLGSFFGGTLYDHRPGHPVLATVLLVSATALILAPLIPLLWLLILIMLMLGIAEGTLDVGGNSLLIWVHGSKVGPFMNGLHFFFGLGAFISPIIIAQVVLLTGDIVWAYWMLAILMIPIAVWILRTPSPVPHKASEDSNSPTVKPLLVALITLFYFTFIGIEAGFGNWLYTYATHLKLTNEVTGAYLTSAFWGSFTAGRLVSIPLAIRFRPRTLLSSDLVGCLFSVGVILLWPHSHQALWFGAIGVGLSQASLFPIMLAWAERRIRLTGRINSFFFMGTGAGGMFFPWFIGQLIEPIGPQAVMVVILFEIIATSVILGVLLFYAPQPVRALAISHVDKHEYDQVMG